MQSAHGQPNRPEVNMKKNNKIMTSNRTETENEKNIMYVLHGYDMQVIIPSKNIIYLTAKKRHRLHCDGFDRF